jgi:hypothetical protein
MKIVQHLRSALDLNLRPAQVGEPEAVRPPALVGTQRRAAPRISIMMAAHPWISNVAGRPPSELSPTQT